MSKRDPDEIARRDRIAREQVEEKIRQSVENAPPLPPDAKEKLRSIIALHTDYPNSAES